MARKQGKKRTFGRSRTESVTPAFTSTTATTTSPAVKPAVSHDHFRFAYVAKDLKQIAIILVVILSLYLGIYLANQSLHLF